MGERNSTFSKMVVIGLFLCAAVFLLIYFLIPPEGPSALDRMTGVWIAGTETPGWTKVMQTVSVLGGSAVIVALTLLLTAVAAWFTGIRKAMWILAGVAVAYLANTALKAWIARPRPAVAWGIEANGFSFPSGNAMLAIVLYGMFAIWMGRYGRVGKKAGAAIGWISALLIILTGWSRLYFGVHYVTDILAGYASGGFIVLLLMLSERKFGKSP